MIHPLDDYPVHQSSAPLLHPTSDSPGVYDRYFFNGYDLAGSIFFGVALGVYPNRKVMDAAFSVRLDGLQHNLRSSRRCERDRTVTTVGAVTVEVIRPMAEHRVIVRDTCGMSAELTWRTDSPVLEEPTFRHIDGGLTKMDYTRITQFGTWTGWVRVDDTRIDLADLGRVQGCRDRSWGSRSSSKGIGAGETDRQFFWLWAPGTIAGQHVHAAINEDSSGRAWHRSGAVAGSMTVDGGAPTELLDDSLVRRCTSVDAHIDWRAATRWPDRATITLHRWQAEPLSIDYQPSSRFQMSGLGYTHPDWWHGAWRGESDESRDVIDHAAVDPLDPRMVHVQQVCRLRAGDAEGVGVLESLAIGAHEPSGFRAALDGATPR